MKFRWRSHKGEVRFESRRVVESRVAPGVRYTIVAMTFERRVALMRRVRELARQAEFLEASTEALERMTAGLLRADIERVYVLWGLESVDGLVVDGRKVDKTTLAELAPEALFREALAEVRRVVGLSEEERKN